MSDQYYIVEFPDDIAAIIHKELQSNKKQDIGRLAGINLIQVQENGTNQYKIEFTNNTKVIFDYTDTDNPEKIPIEKQATYCVCREVDKTEHIMLNVVNNGDQDSEYSVQGATNVFRRAYKDTKQL